MALGHKIRGKLAKHRRAEKTINSSSNMGVCKTFLKLLFSHVGLFILVTIYAVAGAYFFISYELPAEEERFEKKKLASEMMEESKIYMAKAAVYLNATSLTVQSFRSEMEKEILLLHFFIVTKAQTANYDRHPNSWNYDWTLPKSILFTATTMGAIGYGHIAPQTVSMRICTIYYGMLGIPLLLLFLANIGDALAKAFTYVYSRMCCRWCRMRRKVSELKNKVTRQILWKEEVGLEPYMPTDHADVPITINLLLIFVYLVIGGALFSYWENWEVHEAAYFTFITLTTIGFGDYVPGNSFAVGGDNDDVAAALKMITTIGFCLFGMALLSMAINLMKEQLVEKTKWLATEMGVMEEDFDPKVKYNIKRSNDDYIQATPPDKDGNKRQHLLFTNDFDDEKRGLMRHDHNAI